MFNKEGMTMYGSILYKEMERPKRLVYVQDFRDADDRLSRHPMLPVWPESMTATVSFTAEGPRETRVTVQWEPAANASAEEVAAFVAHRPSMTQGWTGSFDQLDELLTQSVPMKP
jgi:uncharacterized protein YndB with AHSA1/START domain